MLDRSSKVFIAGHRGLVGSAVLRCFKAKGFNRLVTREHADLDLTDQMATRNFFSDQKPEVVVLAAAKVGGINANSTFPAEFIYNNLAIQSNVINEALRLDVQQLLFLGSSCIYPRDCPQPILERYLLTGPLEPTNQPYAVAKIAGVEMCWSYNRQYGTRYLAVMPTNCYGPRDNYDLRNAHVLPALIRKIHEAKELKETSFQAWGTGSVWREFLYSDDLAEACFCLLDLPKDRQELLYEVDQPPLINVGSGLEVQVRELATAVARVIGFDGEVVWDHTKPDGPARKLLDTTRMSNLGWQAQIGLEEGISLAYEDFLRRYA